MSPPARDGATEWSGCSLGCGIMPWSYSSACESDETVRINSDAERVGACSTSHEGGHSREPRGFVSTLRKLNTNWRSMSNRKESHHRHGRPSPAHTFTPYPPINLTALSRPAAWQPCRPASSSPNGSRHAAISGTEAVQQAKLAQNTNPLGGIIMIMSTFISYQMIERSFRLLLRQDSFEESSAAPPRLGACLDSRLDHRPPSASPAPSHAATSESTAP